MTPLLRGAEGPRLPWVGVGVTTELARFRSATIRRVVYDVALSIPTTAAHHVRGRTTVSFHWHDPERRPVVLDFTDPGERVEHVRVNGRVATWRGEGDHVVLGPEALLQGGRNEVCITHRGGEQGLHRRGDLIYTLFVPDRAHGAMPVFDQPDLRASFTLALTVPVGWTAVSNAPAVGVPSPGGGFADAADQDGPVHTFHFAPTRPLPTYLFAFATGRFEVEEDGNGLRMFHRGCDAERLARGVGAVFGLHRRALAWLEEYTGVAHPFEKLDVVLIPSFEYGGMEHPGAIFYREDSLLLGSAPTEAELLGRASLVAHETAHLWFGDLVTLRWFDDVWMKEVFANLLAARIVQPSFPELHHDLRFLLTHHTAAYLVDRTPGANPVRQTLGNLRDAGSLYGPIVYHKSPIAMRQLERRLGPDVLRDGLRDFLTRFAFGSAAWPDLVELLNARTDVDLGPWSRAWLEEPGRPTVEVVLETRDGRVERIGVRQSDPAGKGRLWPQRVEVALVFADRTVSMEVLDLLESQSEAWLPAWRGRPAPDFVLPGAGGVGYGRFVLDQNNLAGLALGLPRLGDPLLRGAAWLTLWDAVLDESLAPERFLALSLAALGDEPVELIVQWILDRVDELWWRLLPASSRVALAPEVEGVLWAEANGTRAQTARAAFLAAYRSAATTAAATDRLMALWSGGQAPPVPLSGADQAALALALSLRDVRGSSAVIAEQARRDPDPERRARLLYVARAVSPDAGEREASFQALLDPLTRGPESWALEALTLLVHPLRQGQGRTFLSRGLRALEDVQRTGDIFFPERWLRALLGGHNTPEALDAVDAFLAATPELPPRLRAKVLQVADELSRAVRIVHGAGSEQGPPDR